MTQPRSQGTIASSSSTDKLAMEHFLEELIPFFRRWKQSLVRDLIYTFIMGVGFWLFFFALYLYGVPPGHLVQQAIGVFVISMAISYAIHGLYLLGDAVLGAWPRRAHGWQRAAYNIATLTSGVFGGYSIALMLLNPAATRHNIFSLPAILSFTIVSVIVSCALLYASLVRERELLGEVRLAAEQRRALEAQLRMLQAQIEPHFLYNTLANAVGLIQPAPDRARLLLERLIDYLRATLAASRDAETPLQREIDSITAYLELMKLRMGERLRYRIELTDEAARLRMPPMLLQPIVENAISHGLEPKLEGGEIALTASVEKRHVLIVISDTGVGFRTDAPRKVGGGVGLSNLRERIATLYGGDGSLSIAENTVGGVSVTLRIPLANLLDSECRGAEVIDPAI